MLFRYSGIQRRLDWPVRLPLSTGVSLEKIIKAIATVPIQLAEAPWAGLLWDVANRRMIMSGYNRNLSARILIFGLTGNVSLAGKTEKEMLVEGASIVGKASRFLQLPSLAKLRTR